MKSLQKTKANGCWRDPQNHTQTSLCLCLCLCLWGTWEVAAAGHNSVVEEFDDIPNTASSGNRSPLNAAAGRDGCTSASFGALAMAIRRPLSALTTIHSRSYKKPDPQKQKHRPQQKPTQNHSPTITTTNNCLRSMVVENGREQFAVWSKKRIVFLGYGNICSCCCYLLQRWLH